jgi:hypothetical protein
MPSAESTAAALALQHAFSIDGDPATRTDRIATIIDGHFSDYVEVKRERDDLRRQRKEARAGIAEAIIKLQETACF